MKLPNTVFIGHVCIDRNDAEHTSYVSWGSSVLYMSRYFQDHFGITPEVIGTYGSDALEYLQGFHIHPDKPQAKHTLLNENIMSGREKDRVRYSYHAEEPTPPDITPDVKKLLKDSEILVLATLLPNYDYEYVKKIMSHVKPSCLKVLIVQGYLRQVNNDGLVNTRDFPEANEILPMFDLAVLSDDDHPRAIDLAKSWKKNLPSTEIIVTQGPQGASIIQPDSANNIPTKPLPVEEIVDSVGCGDIFTAVITFHYYQTRDLVSAIQAAHRAARIKLVSTNASE